MENQKQFQKFGLTMRFFVWVIYCSLYHGTEYGIEYNSWLFIYRERKRLYISFKARILQTLFHRVFIYFYFWLILMIYFLPDTTVSWLLKDLHLFILLFFETRGGAWAMPHVWKLEDTFLEVSSSLLHVFSGELDSYVQAWQQSLYP